MAITAESLIRDLEAGLGVLCKVCRAPLCPHELLIAVALGFRNAPRCPACLGTALQREPNELRESVIAYIHQRECFESAWSWATHAEHAEGRPCGLAAAEHVSVRIAGPGNAGGQGGVSSRVPAEEGPTNTEVEHQLEWDAGEMGCGELVLELRLRLEGMEPGQVMKLCARDPGAPEDLPAWCRLTGHRLCAAQHPHYWIKRKETNAR
jgi:tRNA 2-thiouridine synthesizing protein A